jgi:hypothetical protein
MRAVEREIIHIAQTSAGLAALNRADDRFVPVVAEALTIGSSSDEGRPPPVPVLTHLMQYVTSPNQAHPIFRGAMILLYVSLAAPVTIITFFTLQQIQNHAVKNTASFFYACVALGLGYTLWLTTMGSRRFWYTARDRLTARLRTQLYGQRQS